MLSKEEKSEIDNVYKMFNTKISDCNKCPYLNITEEKQNEIYKETGIKPPHLCRKYKAKVIHKCAISKKEEHSKIFPLDLCETKEIEIYFANGGAKWKLK